MGYEADNYIGTATIGAVPGNKLIKRLLQVYDEEIWNMNIVNNPMIFKYILDSEPGYLENLKIYPQEYFSPYVPNVYVDGKVEKENTYAIHWYTKDWNMSRKGYIFIHTKHIKNPIKKFIESCKKSIGYYRNK